jgi:hypothetical protein
LHGSLSAKFESAQHRTTLASTGKIPYMNAIQLCISLIVESVVLNIVITKFLIPLIADDRLLLEHIDFDLSNQALEYRRIE